MAALEAYSTGNNADDPHESSLLHWHQRLGHLAFDTIERMARDPKSGHRLSSNKRMAYVSCLEGKQTRNAQSINAAACTRPSIASETSSDRTWRDAAAKKFDTFLVHFEKLFGFKIHVLLPDGGGEYTNVDLIYERQGFARQG
uniref:GAG-pre-integrase domain-containing protein n=1 Tax=Peronospora matthiolae TaxID=2874970 RepID=A0AAV1ULP9_9STRA